jgi:hypothetical protein
MRIRQVALVAADLERALAELQELFAIEVGFRDPGVATFGLANGVMPIGEHFLEVVSPMQPNTSAGRYLERRRPRTTSGDASNGEATTGDGGYMVIFQTHDLARRRRHFADLSVRIAWEIALDDIETVHLHPRDTGGAIVSMDEARPWSSWRWGGPSWPEHVRTSRVRGIAGVEIQSDDPRELARRWTEMFELTAGDSSDTWTLGDSEGSAETPQWIRFCEASDGRGEGIRTIALHATDADAVRRAARTIDDDGAIVAAGVRFALEG